MRGKYHPPKKRQRLKGGEYQQIKECEEKNDCFSTTEENITVQLKQILARLYILHLQPVCFTSGPWWEFRGSFVWPQDGQLEVKWANKHLPDSQVACLRDTFSNLLSCTLGDFQTKLIVVLCSVKQSQFDSAGSLRQRLPCVFFFS